MTTPAIPENPFELVEQPPLALTGRLQRDVFGIPVDVLSIPRRTERAGIPGPGRPPFQANRADEIIAKEAVWRVPGMAITGNRFPFADQQLLLWSTERRREPTLEMLELAFDLQEAAGGTAIVNSIGAAGSITRSHIHIVSGASTFLRDLEAIPLDPASIHLRDEQLGAGCACVRLAEPFDVIAVGIRGPTTDRARAMHHLLECRTDGAFNLISSEDTAWLIPRRVEVTAPHFPQALGGAEISGRWCCNDPEVFDRLSTADMEAAIRQGGVPWPTS